MTGTSFFDESKEQSRIKSTISPSAHKLSAVVIKEGMIDEMYEGLPTEAKAAIEKRDRGA